jgi:cysteinyl-tRNA synthetase
MALAFYDTLRREIVPFEPLVPGEVRMYTCGPTVHDFAHIGNLRTFLFEDLLRRVLVARGYRVTQVMNLTDVDDKIIERGNREGVPSEEIARTYSDAYIEDTDRLGLGRPDVEPRATEHIPEIIELCKTLVDKGMAYETGGSVYFRVGRFPGYGKLSGQKTDQMKHMEPKRDGEAKESPLDFAIWKAAKPGEPSWESPWGAGRPGWHIECSTMSSQFLGQTIDIHGGGGDLIFPHHECEIAQAEPILNNGLSDAQPFSRFWLHTAMVHHEGEKMSKSLGNLVMARDLLKSWSPDALRLYLSSYHYRQIWSHDPLQLARAGTLAQELTKAVSATSGQGSALDPGQAKETFDEVLAEDLATPAAQAIMAQLADAILTGSQAGQDVSQAQAALRQMGTVFGLRLDASGLEPRVIEGWSQHLQRFIHA